MKIGGQAEIRPGLFLGGAVDYEYGTFSGNDGLTSAYSNSVLAVASIKAELGRWLLTGALDFGYGWLKSERAVPLAGAIASASSNSFNVGLHGRAAYHVPFARFYLEPAFDTDLNDVNLPGYTESGAGAYNLKVDSANNVIATATPNLRVGTRLAVGHAVIDAYVGAGVSFITGNDYKTNARFAVAPASLGGFTNTLKNDSVAGKFSAGVEVYTTRRIDLRLEYDGLVADHQTENGGQVRLSYKF